MTRIIKYRVQGLWNSEYPLVINRIIDIVGAHRPHEIYLGQSYNRLAAFRTELAKIEVQERADRESALLSELDQRRDTLFNVIHTTAKTLQRTPIAEISNHAHRLVTLFKKHGSDMPTTNYTAQTKRMYDMAADFTAQPDVMASLEALSLRPLFEQMVEINRAFDEKFMQRNQRQAATERVDARNIRLECDKALTLLWNAIEFCMMEYGEENYLPMVHTINRLNAYYKQQLAARAARRKAKQEVEKEEPIKPMEE